jgi:hypothetical protein
MLGEPDTLQETREWAIEKLDGLADDGLLLRDQCDGWTKVRLLVRGRFALDANASRADAARKLAELALARLPR